ncbi:VOC family protein [Pseudonocardia asaccharolytica]|uniref:Biphenyl-2,3-diol 1,2-dioxygenase n=1 Tax=Pseudonocardia asaccharolytica DSM 44247 = NBRC 16224 TaxID=1123024 RepID=A0A511D4Y6_9PSEU|nr:VOC family protein [Pseudonocardia asaccharolytica]GEL19852.1 biphenyl-2,3-diol 1,2-dioxygenase [Pseudonocardia asaccharolytica DSM 44247 = NBRC 16224]
MGISRLGSVAFDCVDVAAVAHVLVDLFGLEPLPRNDAADPLYLRLDEHHHRIALHPAPTDGIHAIAWEVDTPEELGRLRARLLDRGIAVEEVPQPDAEQRHVVAAIRFHDPEGFPTEIVYGPTIDHRPVRLTGPIGGFVTGELGLGHVVYMCKDYPDAVDFYVHTLGFSLSDYIVWAGADATFLHCNPRHHSLALMNECFDFTGGDFNHLMLEVRDIDDVGRAYEIAKAEGLPFIMDYGRHTNDEVTSFYVTLPGGFGLEIGAGGLLVDEEKWQVRSYTSPSRWGHQLVG